MITPKAFQKFHIGTAAACKVSSNRYIRFRSLSITNGDSIMHISVSQSIPVEIVTSLELQN